MSTVAIHLPDNSVKEFPQEPTVLEVAQSIGSRLAQDTVGAQLNGEPEVVDLRTPLPHETRLRIITTRDRESLEVIRHSAAHVMAEAVQEVWPDVKVTIGPVIEDGFFYDFDSPRPFTPEDLEQVEKKMLEVIRRGERFKKKFGLWKRRSPPLKRWGRDLKLKSSKTWE